MASVTVVFGGQEQKTHELDKPRMVVGREPSCDIHIDNLGISRNHCAFVAKGEAFVVQDLSSSNGTYVNGAKITERFLNDGDEIIIGKYSLKFRNQVQAAAAPEAASKGAEEIPDTLNTYVMEPGKVREQLDKMRAQQGAAGAPPPVGATAKDYAKALDPGQAAAVSAVEVGRLKALVLALVAVVIVLLVVIVLMFAGVISAHAPAPAPAGLVCAFSLLV